MTLIQRHDGTMYDLLDYGIRTRDLIISAPTPEHEFGKVEGANGVIDYGTSYGPRNITAYYRAQSNDFIDFSLLRDEIFNLFRTEESFYLIEKRLRGKRWLVKVADPYAIPQRNVYGNFEIEFIGIKGVSESIGTTMDIDSNGTNNDFWGPGMGFDDISRSPQYSFRLFINSVINEQLMLPWQSVVPHNSKDPGSFSVYNAGSVPIHPFEQQLKITVKDAVNSIDFIEIINKTNGTGFYLKEGLGNRTLVIRGAQVEINGLQSLRKTDKEFITLEPGWNQFEFKGAEAATIEFDFKFYYL